MRIVTRPDIEGVVCAALLSIVEQITAPIEWVAPSDMQEGVVVIRDGDIIANLPNDPNCSLWFDHHISNRINRPFRGTYKLEPSAARVVYNYYKEKFSHDYETLVRETDKIDSAALSLDEVVHPENYPYVILSMTIQSHCPEDAPYWNLLVNLLQTDDAEKIVKHPEARRRCDEVIEQNRVYEGLLKAHTKIKGNVAVTDFRSFDYKPHGNRYLVYALYSEAIVHLNISCHDHDRSQVVVGVGYNIFNRRCRVNVGELLSKFGGGGHRTVGACQFHIDEAEIYLSQIMDVLIKNEG
jgi:oligoribonuclease NrnB/cAMP/cGMP phosphodiesterase (DHH superfamily)